MKRCCMGLLVALALLTSAAEVQAQFRRPFFAGRVYRPYWPGWGRGYPYPVPYPYFLPYAMDPNPGYGVVPAGAQQPQAETPPTDNRARIAIRLPTYAADVWVDDQKMTDRLADERLYVSPTLEPGHTYAYTIKARFVRRGENVTEERVVHVRANETTTVDFAAATTPTTVSAR